MQTVIDKLEAKVAFHEGAANSHPNPIQQAGHRVAAEAYQTAIALVEADKPAKSIHQIIGRAN